jgi:hypothetical protein
VYYCVSYVYHYGDGIDGQGHHFSLSLGVDGLGSWFGLVGLVGPQVWSPVWCIVLRCWLLGVAVAVARSIIIVHEDRMA